MNREPLSNLLLEYPLLAVSKHIQQDNFLNDEVADFRCFETINLLTIDSYGTHQADNEKFSSAQSFIPKPSAGNHWNNRRKRNRQVQYS